MPVWPEAEVGNPNIISPYALCAMGPLLDRFAAGVSSAAAFFAWPTANKAYFYPFRIRNRPWVAKKAFLWNGSAVSGNVDIGIYDKNGNRLVSTGSTAQAGTSVIQIIDCTDTTLDPGRYFLGLSIDNTTGRTNRTGGISVNALALANCWTMASAFPLPDPMTFTVIDVAHVPVFGFSNFTV